jgi:hypothetical protein
MLQINLSVIFIHCFLEMKQVQTLKMKQTKSNPTKGKKKNQN